MSLHRMSLLVSPADCSAITSLALPVSITVATVSDNELLLNDIKGGAVTFGQIFPFVVGLVALSKAGLAQMKQVSDSWAVHAGESAPPMMVLDNPNGTERRADIVEWLAGQLAGNQQQMARRTTTLMRELAILRQQHETMQESFRRLEQFVQGNGLTHRVLETTLSPVQGQQPISLGGGSSLVARLPGSSVGLCDIAIQINNAGILPEGRLSCSLLSTDSKVTVATWEVSHDRLREGWLRLSLDNALGMDPISLKLHLTWHGKGNLLLATAMIHPDARFHPSLDHAELDAMLAIQLWRWVPDAAAPLAADAISQVGGQGKLHYVEASLLATATAPGSEERLPMLDDSASLLVHVDPKLTKCAVLPGIALPGVRQVSGRIHTRHPKGPAVEYCLALLPQSRRTSQSGLPHFDPKLSSGWICLQPDEGGQATVLAPEALKEPHDIYMLTRLPNGTNTNEYGWSTFSDIRLRF